MSFFYPNIDFAQNVRQLLPALYVGDPGHGRFLWTFDSAFWVRQELADGARVAITTLELPEEGHQLRFTDFCPPDAPALVRRVYLRAGPGGFRGTFMQYYELRLGEVTGKQSVRVRHEDGVTLQYFRDIALAVGGERPSVWRCGKSIDDGPRSAKSDMYDGHLNGQEEDIGQVDFALGWHVALEPGEWREFDVILAAAHNRDEAVRLALDLAAAGGAELLSRRYREDRTWLERLRRPTVQERIARAYDRALLSLRMLQDAATGAVVAAPEFDPAYEMCGGYGYCWPRDATEAMMALKLAGDESGLERLCRWYLKAQLPSGQWGQRYWTNGQMASSWSLREDFLQVDQTAAALIALCGCEPADPGLWPAIQRGAAALAAMVGPDGWHSFACDLWETFCGSFVYTNAAIWAALRAAAACARRHGEGALAADWERRCASMKKAVLASHNGQHFPRGMLAEGQPDLIVDSSTLGVCEPFGMLSPQVPQERALLESNLQTIEERLNYRLPDGGVGIRRYEGDGYLGGAIGCVNTLWFALVCLQIAASYRGEDDARAEQYVAKALGYLHFCLDHATPTGLLPELIGTQPDYPYWAAPHSWASGLLVKCALELERATHPRE
jgi:oligosaccharide amylase